MRYAVRYAGRYAVRYAVKRAVKRAVIIVSAGSSRSEDTGYRASDASLEEERA